jgi:NAD(P)-dependent dehydrogenase (short-subunit alcohol dehydrogenase family)
MWNSVVRCFTNSPTRYDDSMASTNSVSSTAWPVKATPFELSGGVAVVTGAANGLGLAIARACARAGMKLVLADIDTGGLQSAQRELESLTRCVSLQVDVRQREQVEALASLAFDTFARTDIVFNNAGVLLVRPVLETTPADWQWLLDINLWSVIHGIAAFVPRMLMQGCEGRIVNTASAAGFISESSLAAYCVTKHAVVTLSESLHKELRSKGSMLGVTILSPAFVPTNIAKSGQGRQDAGTARALSPGALEAQAQIEKAIGSGRLTPDDVARKVLQGVRDRSLYVFTHRKIRAGIEERNNAVVNSFAAESEMTS